MANARWKQASKNDKIDGNNAARNALSGSEYCEVFSPTWYDMLQSTKRTL